MSSTFVYLIISNHYPSDTVSDVRFINDFHSAIADTSETLDSLESFIFNYKRRTVRTLRFSNLLN